MARKHEIEHKKESIHRGSGFFSIQGLKKRVCDKNDYFNYVRLTGLLFFSTGIFIFNNIVHCCRVT